MQRQLSSTVSASTVDLDAENTQLQSACWYCTDLVPAEPPQTYLMFVPWPIPCRAHRQALPCHLEVYWISPVEMAWLAKMDSKLNQQATSVLRSRRNNLFFTLLRKAEGNWNSLKPSELCWWPLQYSLYFVVCLLVWSGKVVTSLSLYLLASFHSCKP